MRGAAFPEGSENDGPRDPLELVGEAVTFAVAYEHDDVVVIEKRAGLVTQPGKGHEDDSPARTVYRAQLDTLKNM